MHILISLILVGGAFAIAVFASSPASARTSPGRAAEWRIAGPLPTGGELPVRLPRDVVRTAGELRR